LAEVVRGPLKPMKPAVLTCMVAISAALERAWPKGRAATEACRAPGWLD
jgi:hypothetical protein